MTPSDSQPTRSSQYLRAYRFKVLQTKRKLSQIRLGARGTLALSKLLTADELPIDTLGFFRHELAYTNRKEDARHGATKAQATPVIAEKSYAIPGVNRYISIVVRPYLTVQEVEDGFDNFVNSVKKRFSWAGTSQVVESELQLVQVPNARLVETQTEYSGEQFRTLSVACVADKVLVMVEFQCAADSRWDLAVCGEVLHRQLDKINRVDQTRS